MLVSARGERKYLNEGEISAFVISSRSFGRSVSLFCTVMAYSGCRISEVLEFRRENFDLSYGQLIVRCLKKRKKNVYRTIPLPRKLVQELSRWFQASSCPEGRLWPWSRMTGYRRICEVMEKAGVKGPHATPKGLRHGFGVRAMQNGVPLPLVQRWLGHADVKTTTIYTCAVGPEERSIANKMWGNEDRCVRQSREVPFHIGHKLNYYNEFGVEDSRIFSRSHVNVKVDYRAA
ncbi:tyrosine-type recombinase/integrase [Sphingomonas sp. NCPPB 2930]|uniref:tyrosine-type recombinase/integrase n=1 Tax=Sphingomonas sp. NCPPB 2930 TaxID=3162788 RepID=UPI0036DEF138